MERHGAAAETADLRAGRRVQVDDQPWATATVKTGSEFLLPYVWGEEAWAGWSRAQKRLFFQALPME